MFFSFSRAGGRKILEVLLLVVGRQIGFRCALKNPLVTGTPNRSTEQPGYDKAPGGWAFADKRWTNWEEMATGQISSRSDGGAT